MLDYDYFRSKVPESTVIDYQDTKLKTLADDISQQIMDKMERSAKEQRKVNIILIVIGGLTLIATVAGIVLQVAM